ncbi:MAG: hypothetical protein DWQ47_10635 [Acidobacteria bacterium]|nr:MAG: hypothetical protein DWQ32_13050 [Acidobacteriota bacterium]REJ98042.1 MAG: hypothetical protein DWQ38_15850 [Acidobacteriota bacterium]REK16785.1 MAG: hypothetical protein DWQ43_00895 [Acidobacteriota bacterium]REK42696.1 MAG: hypothetical protein DWQ47_10635 [Acidobacteriota bacterium]
MRKVTLWVQTFLEVWSGGKTGDRRQERSSFRFRVPGSELGSNFKVQGSDIWIVMTGIVRAFKMFGDLIPHMRVPTKPVFAQAKACATDEMSDKLQLVAVKCCVWLGASQRRTRFRRCYVPSLL